MPSMHHTYLKKALALLILCLCIDLSPMAHALAPAPESSTPYIANPLLQEGQKRLTAYKSFEQMIDHLHRHSESRQALIFSLLERLKQEEYNQDALFTRLIVKRLTQLTLEELVYIGTQIKQTRSKKKTNKLQADGNQLINSLLDTLHSFLTDHYYGYKLSIIEGFQTAFLFDPRFKSESIKTFLNPLFDRNFNPSTTEIHNFHLFPFINFIIYCWSLPELINISPALSKIINQNVRHLLKASSHTVATNNKVFPTREKKFYPFFLSALVETISNGLAVNSGNLSVQRDILKIIPYIGHIANVTQTQVAEIILRQLATPLSPSIQQVALETVFHLLDVKTYPEKLPGLLSKKQKSKPVANIHAVFINQSTLHKLKSVSTHLKEYSVQSQFIRLIDKWVPFQEGLHRQKAHLLLSLLSSYEDPRSKEEIIHALGYTYKRLKKVPENTDTKNNIYFELQSILFGSKNLHLQRTAFNVMSTLRKWRTRAILIRTDNVGFYLGMIGAIMTGLVLVLSLVIAKPWIILWTVVGVTLITFLFIRLSIESHHGFSTHSKDFHTLRKSLKVSRDKHLRRNAKQLKTILKFRKDKKLEEFHLTEAKVRQLALTTIPMDKADELSDLIEKIATFHRYLDRLSTLDGVEQSHSLRKSA